MTNRCEDETRWKSELKDDLEADVVLNTSMSVPHTILSAVYTQCTNECAGAHSHEVHKLIQVNCVRFTN